MDYGVRKTLALLSSLVKGKTERKCTTAPGNQYQCALNRLDLKYPLHEPPVDAEDGSLVSEGSREQEREDRGGEGGEDDSARRLSSSAVAVLTLAASKAR